MNKKQTILTVALVSFIAVTFFTNLHIAIFTLFTKSMGVETGIVEYNYVALACKTPHAHTVGGVWFGLRLMVALLFAAASFYICRKGYREQNYLLLIIGAFLFYFPAIQSVNLVYEIGTIGVPWFIKDPAEARQYKLAWFGNQYNYSMLILGIRIIAVISYLLITYVIVFRYWDKRLRLYFFTIGLVSFFAGTAFWMYLLGPRIYPLTY